MEKDQMRIRCKKFKTDPPVIFQYNDSISREKKIKKFTGVWYILFILYIIFIAFFLAIEINAIIYLLFDFQFHQLLDPNYTLYNSTVVTYIVYIFYKNISETKYTVNYIFIWRE